MGVTSILGYVSAGLTLAYCIFYAVDHPTWLIASCCLFVLVEIIVFAALGIQQRRSLTSCIELTGAGAAGVCVVGIDIIYKLLGRWSFNDMPVYLLILIIASLAALIGGIYAAVSVRKYRSEYGAHIKNQAERR